MARTFLNSAHPAINFALGSRYFLKWRELHYRNGLVAYKSVRTCEQQTTSKSTRTSFIPKDMTVIFTTKYREDLFVGYKWFQAKDVKPLFPFG